jgi:hypothetical protein
VDRFSLYFSAVLFVFVALNLIIVFDMEKISDIIPLITGMALWRDTVVYGYSSPLTSLKELVFGS